MQTILLDFLTPDVLLAGTCSRCQRHHELLSGYADDAARLELRVEDLEADNGVLRELVSVSLEQLAKMTGERTRLRDRIAQLLVQLRRVEEQKTV